MYHPQDLGPGGREPVPGQPPVHQLAQHHGEVEELIHRPVDRGATHADSQSSEVYFTML
jgi:hypothetical protein